MSAYPTGDKRLTVRRKLGQILDGIEQAVKALTPGPSRATIQAQLNAIGSAILLLEQKLGAKPKNGLLRCA